MGYYVSNVDTKRKVLTIDDSVEPNKRDQLLIDSYLKVGYTIRFKSQDRTQIAKERAEKNLKVEDIKEIFTDFPELLEEFEEIKSGRGKGKGAFAALSWATKKILNEPEFDEARKNNKKVKDLIKSKEKKKK